MKAYMDNVCTNYDVELGPVQKGYYHGKENRESPDAVVDSTMTWVFVPENNRKQL